MKEQFEKLVASGKIDENHLPALTALIDTGFCSHKSWGVGKINRIDPLRGRIIIDFEAKNEHSMDVVFAAETLKPISHNHILARRIIEPEKLQEMAKTNPMELIRLIMESFNNTATLDQIEKTIVPIIVAEEEWKKWWSNVRIQMKKCGNYVIPTRKVEPIIYQPGINSLQQRYSNDFKQTRGFKPRLNLLSKIIQNLEELDNPASLGQEILPILNNDIKTHIEIKPELALEGIFLRDELKKLLEEESEEEISPTTIWEQHPNGVKIIELLPPSFHKEAIISFKEVYPETWANLFLENINNISPKFCEEVATLLIDNHYTEKLGEILALLINQHQANSNLLLWLAKSKPEQFENLMNASTLRCILAEIERDQFNNIRSCPLRDYVLNDKHFIADMISYSDIEEVKDITRSIQFSPAFEDMDKRSILMRVVKLFPVIQNLISGDQSAKQDNALIVSWESLQNKKNEYEDLIHNRIPANTKEIAIARSYGDLRENHEFKAAREMQKLLMKLKGEMEYDLERARGTDFKDAPTNEIGIGSQATLEDISTHTDINYLILGAWDFDDGKNIISYLSPIAQAMMHKKVGEIVTFGSKEFKVKSIAPAFPFSKDN